MMKHSKLLKFGLIPAALLTASTGSALAHPHVYAEARLEIVIGNQGTVEELRHVWRFDDLFSSTILLDFDTNANLKLESSELLEIGTVVRNSLADYDYYTAISHDGRAVKILPPDAIHVDFQDGQILMFFAVRPETPLPLQGLLSFGAYDPTMYAALDFLTDDDLVVDGLQPGCSKAIIRPDPDDVMAQNQATLTEAFFNDPQGNDISKLFATRLELTC